MTPEQLSQAVSNVGGSLTVQQAAVLMVRDEFRLYAAAPELLEALKALQIQALQSELNTPSHEWGWEALQKTAAAISKATGAA